MNIPFYDLKPQHDIARSALDNAYARVMSGPSFILGPELTAFEAAFASYCETQYCIGVGNGLEAIALALKALGVVEGDEVLVPSHTYIATWLGVTQIGAIPVPVEPDPKTYNLDPNRVEEAITPKTRAIIPVHLYGQPADMVSIMEIANRYNLVVVEDSAQAHGATIQGKKAGSFGHAAAFSFYPTKNLGALGDGGAVTTSDPDVKTKLELLRNYGSKIKYEHEIQAGNSRLDELQAAFLHAKLHFLDQWNAERRHIAGLYSDLLKNIDHVQTPHIPNWAEPVWHQYVIRSKYRDRLVKKLAEEKIGAMIHYPKPPHLQLAYQADYAEASFPIAEKLAMEVISLPMWPGMTETQIKSIALSIREAS